MSSLNDLKKQMKIRRLAMKNARGDIPTENENSNINKIIQILTGFKSGHTKKDDFEITSSLQYLSVSEQNELKQLVLIKFGCKSQHFLYINTLLEKQKIKPKHIKPQQPSTIIETNGHERKKLQLIY